MEHGIKICKLQKNFGNQEVLNDISFDIKKREIVGFLGLNGAGKSTTMKIITTTMNADAGKVYVCGYDTEKNPLQVKKCIGYLSENNPLYSGMYVIEYLYFMGRLHKIPNLKSRVKEIINIVDIESHIDTKIKNLSKGYRQRVALAQVLLHDPKILILDEPTNGLDPSQIRIFRNLIQRIAKDKTVLLSTHIMQEVQAMCTRIIILHQGKILIDTDIQSIQSYFDTIQLTIHFEKPVSVEDYANINTIHDIEQPSELILKIQTNSDVAEIQSNIIDISKKMGNSIAEIKKSDASLEDIFVRLTKINSL